MKNITINFGKKNKLGNQFSLLNTIKNHLCYYPTPNNIFYIWGLGSLLGIMLVIQVITGVLLAMHYVPNIDLAFESVERIMREIPTGWFLRYMHANGASMIFILIYSHMARGIYYQSFRSPKQWVWSSGVIIFILMSGVAFLGYTLPWGQMSFWGATVITNIVTAIPVIGNHIVIWVWGGFSVNNNTLNRFFSLHYFLSIIILGLSLLHLILLHEVGSTSPNGRKSDMDYTKFFPYFYLKDLSTLLFFILFYFIIIFYKPNMFGHPDNYIRASALVTPAHIVPEWYFLPFYAMLKSFPSKLGGAVCMIGAMLILLTLPWTTENGLEIAEPKYRPGYNFLFIIFIITMLLLGWLGGKAATEITMLLSQISTAYYLLYFIIILPFYSQFIKLNNIFILKNFKLLLSFFILNNFWIKIKNNLKNNNKFEWFIFFMYGILFFAFKDYILTNKALTLSVNHFLFIMGFVLLLIFLKICTIVNFSKQDFFYLIKLNFITFAIMITILFFYKLIFIYFINYMGYNNYIPFHFNLFERIETISIFFIYGYICKKWSFIKKYNSTNIMFRGFSFYLFIFVIGLIFNPLIIFPFLGILILSFLPKKIVLNFISTNKTDRICAWFLYFFFILLSFGQTMYINWDFLLILFFNIDYILSKFNAGQLWSLFKNDVLLTIYRWFYPLKNPVDVDVDIGTQSTDKILDSNETNKNSLINSEMRPISQLADKIARAGNPLLSSGSAAAGSRRSAVAVGHSELTERAKSLSSEGPRADEPAAAAQPTDNNNNGGERTSEHSGGERTSGHSGGERTSSQTGTGDSLDGILLTAGSIGTVAATYQVSRVRDVEYSNMTREQMQQAIRQNAGDQFGSNSTFAIETVKMDKTTEQEVSELRGEIAELRQVIEAQAGIRPSPAAPAKKD